MPDPSASFRAMGNMGWKLGLVWLLIFGGGALSASPCQKPAASCRAHLMVPGGMVPYYSTHRLTETNPQIERAVIVVHGTARNADEYFTDTAQAAVLAGVSDKALVLAPHFQAEEDGAAPGELYWDSSGWKRGDDSLNGRGLSSFTAVDLLIARLSNGKELPALKDIVVTGHSAGGQLASRFAALSLAELQLKNVRVHYVISNPSTYLYPNEYREVPGSPGVFDRPKGGCPDYDDYPYGAVAPNDYASQISVAVMGHHLAHRRVTLLLGEADTLSDYLDVSCGANLQGPNRISRGLSYARYLTHFFHPKSLRVSVVPAVGHSGKDMYQSAEGRDALFK
jgi:pimeloyl-ACP methyl ester carboxylesterase